MLPEAEPCLRCGELVPSGLVACPNCGDPVDVSGGLLGPPSEPDSPQAAELDPGLARLRKWRETADTIGVELPEVPRWVRTLVAEGAPEAADLLEEAEASVRQHLVLEFEVWEGTMRGRIDDLESHGIETRVDRDQVTATLERARAGEVEKAIAARKAAERTVSLKERHLKEAREGLESTLRIFEDMRSLGLEVPRAHSDLAARLGSELRTGQFAALKQELRQVRSEVSRSLKSALPKWVSGYGRKLAGEREGGAEVDERAAELARALKLFLEDRPEEALHRLRALREGRGPIPERAPGQEPSDEGS